MPGAHRAARRSGPGCLWRESGVLRTHCPGMAPALPGTCPAREKTREPLGCSPTRKALRKPAASSSARVGLSRPIPPVLLHPAGIRSPVRTYLSGRAGRGSTPRLSSSRWTCGQSKRVGRGEPRQIRPRRGLRGPRRGRGRGAPLCPCESCGAARALTSSLCRCCSSRLSGRGSAAAIYAGGAVPRR